MVTREVNELPNDFVDESNYQEEVNEPHVITPVLGVWSEVPRKMMRFG